ncbi:hypothetical protein NDU88_005195 [Pleurodeles waltl]|uniref:Uncharacterized protein n=1 Tax=Pleurodeles waltl TaxID=8319 RepID=A0AAV7TA02_PLEWA|nr:hypothetical protein NDU88_005195 [Pleurodeles waltl]
MKNTETNNTNRRLPNFEQQDKAFDKQDRSHVSKKGEKNATAALEGSEEEIGKEEDQGSEMQVGGSLSEADMQEETVSLNEVPGTWSEEWYASLEKTGEAQQLRRVAV